jgi:coatomer subunit beta'
LEIANAPIRCAKFIARKQWLIVGSDDNKLRVYNYNTSEKLKTITEHADFIRNVMVHPTLSYVFSCGDDDKIFMFDWDKNWERVNSYEDHEHYVM